MVQDVKDFCSDLQIEPFRNLIIFEEREVEIDEPRANKAITTRIATKVETCAWGEICQARVAE